MPPPPAEDSPAVREIPLSGEMSASQIKGFPFSAKKMSQRGTALPGIKGVLEKASLLRCFLVLFAFGE